MSNKITELDRRIWENSTVAKDLGKCLHLRFKRQSHEMVKHTQAIV